MHALALPMARETSGSALTVTNTFFRIVAVVHKRRLLYLHIVDTKETCLVLHIAVRAIGLTEA